jgi:hypothetical protein
MHARAASLAREFDELRLPRVQHASRRRGGGSGPRDPRAGISNRRPGSNAAFPVHAAIRNRRRLARKPIPVGSHLAAAV